VTVAVVSWNTRALLADCLRSLRGAAETGLAEVWVVDNASEDGSAALVREQFPWVELIASPKNLGFGAAVNLVARRTRSPWLAPANADIQLRPQALTNLLIAAEQHPRAAVLAPRLTLPDGRAQHSAYPFPTVAFTAAYVCGLTRLSRRAAHHWCIDNGFDPAEAREVPWAVGAFLLVRRSGWEQVGGFDEGQWMYAEDLDLGWRLHRAGWQTRFVPGAEVLHAESAATTRAWGNDRHLRWHASTYAWLLRRRGLAYARLIATINVLGFLLRAALLWPLRGSRPGAGPAAFYAARAHSVGLRPRRLLEDAR
jgi:N-acetylglucosaminyl-diphospho-decaprenol L-rhamnosyltransferase